MRSLIWIAQVHPLRIVQDSSVVKIVRIIPAVFVILVCVLMVEWLIASVYRPVQEDFTQRGTSSLPVLGLCSSLTAFKQAGVFIVPCLPSRDLGFQGLIRGTNPWVVSYYKPGILRTYSNLGSQEVHIDQ